MATSRRLPGPLMEQLHNLLLRAYQESDMRLFLRFRMDADYDGISSTNKNKEERFYDVLEWAERKGRLLELVQKGAENRPEHPEFSNLADQIEGTLTTTTPQSPSRQNKPTSFPYTEIRDALIQCAPLQSNRTLSVLFVDDRIYPWRNSVPSGNNVQERAEALIDLLRDKENAAGENGLRLFLEVAADRLNPQDACHGRLLDLARQL